MQLPSQQITISPSLSLLSSWNMQPMPTRCSTLHINNFASFLIIIMLGEGLSSKHRMEMSKSSFLAEQADEKKLKQMIEDRDKTIRKLNSKIDKLQATLRRTNHSKNTQEHGQRSNNQDNNHFQMLKVEVGKTQQLEDIVKSITTRINLLLEELAQDNSFTDNSQELRQFLQELGEQNNVSVSLEIYEDQLHNSISISQEWRKIIDILEGTVRGLKIKCIAFKEERKVLENSIKEAHKKTEDLMLRLNNNQEVQLLTAQLKEQRKQREKLRGLLDKSEKQKNQLINKINNAGLAVRVKTKEELLQYSKELSYRVQDLEKEKEDILKQANKQKETQLRKYQEVLKRLRRIKETSRLGKSYA